MQTSRGFTVVEIAITLAVMAILVVLGLSSYSQSQKNARDTERRGDAENISAALERLYASGATNSATGITYPPGRYPSIDEAQQATFLSHTLPGLDAASRSYSFNTSPTGNLFRTDSGASVSENAESQTAKDRIALETNDTSITYQPMRFNTSTNTWVSCKTSAEECRRYKLYYRTENPVGSEYVQVIESQH